ncbi:MAG: hypothetical protein AAF721_37945, partial [Myxococcota bacterium]
MVRAQTRGDRRRVRGSGRVGRCAAMALVGSLLSCGGTAPDDATSTAPRPSAAPRDAGSRPPDPVSAPIAT